MEMQNSKVKSGKKNEQWIEGGRRRGGGKEAGWEGGARNPYWWFRDWECLNSDLVSLGTLLNWR